MPDLGGLLGGLGDSVGRGLGGLLDGLAGLARGTFGAAGIGLLAGLALIAAAFLVLWLAARR
ncbi:MAG TPA: hypothetical protein VFW92_03945 [Candidatus Limnocylindrales bacterium]|nr:hypothetical protein [Candidatus Limnocylindrales bacterium]